MSADTVWSRLVRFVSPDGRVLCGEPEDPEVDVGLAVTAQQPVSVRVLGGSSALENTKFTGEVTTIQKARLLCIRKLLSPLAAHEVGTIRAIGLNYTDHAAELKMTIPTIPEVFMKPSSCLHDPTAPVTLPRSASDAVDAEVELAVVISKDCKNVDEASALSYVLGYTTANDITARDVQSRTSQWGFSKGFDGFCPLGPALVSPKSLPDISGLKLQTVLNGQVLQDGRAADMIFSVQQIIAYLSKDTTLPKGTVILTGTPSGIGHSHRPPAYLKEGCELRVRISSGLGTLTNTVISEAATQPRL